MASDLVLCLDSGTTTVKAAVFDRDGRAVAHAEIPNSALERHGNRVEQDMERTIADAEAAVSQCLLQVSGEICAFALTAQGDGLWPLDGEGQPAGKAMTWLDGRASALLASMPAALDAVEAITSSRPTAASQTLQLLWLQRNEPERFASIRHALRLKEWLFFRMTGTLCAESGSVLPAWGDWRSGEAHPDIPGLLGLEKGTELLPPIGTVGSCIAGLSKQAAGRMALPEGLPVILGPGDVQSTFVGLGVGPGFELTRASIFGTSAIHGRYFAEAAAIPRKHSGGMVQRFAGGGGFLCFHPAFNGGTVFRHAARVLGAEMQPGYRPAYSGVVLHPFFEPGGERAPIAHPFASAAAFGVSARTTPEQISWAAREAVAFLTRMAHADLGTDDREMVSVGGGVARDPVFLQLLANVLERPVQPHAGGETALRGLAAVATGALDTGSDDEAAPNGSYLAPAGAEIEPEGGAVAGYLGRKRAIFERLLDEVSRHWEDIAGLEEVASGLA
ncbi:FGGY family carbohydrate kinase [Hoeflea olei]|uniref:Carbohydrate kinase n=1 Tax=Hoeflea olei TaxID=1480615 RepID=A0A1C1YRN5_9HYPH|nr:FGGY family carbohydrate kinase [Hoeflea olei]OCW56030.1 hypothetical protein AWJ14_12505 [Hoeflea olei]